MLENNIKILNYQEFIAINKPIVTAYLKDKINMYPIGIGNENIPMLLIKEPIEIVNHALAFTGTLALTKAGKIAFNPKANDSQIMYQKDNNCIVETKKVALDDAVINVFYRYLQRELN